LTNCISVGHLNHHFTGHCHSYTSFLIGSRTVLATAEISCSIFSQNLQNMSLFATSVNTAIYQ